MGHTPTAPGASGLLDELREDRAIGTRLIAELRARGHTVYDSTPADGLAYPAEVNQRVANANATDAELVVSIHLNAGGGSGTEVLHYAGSAEGQAYAERISSKLASVLGLPNRGAKANDWVGIITSTDATAVLIEVCFVDRQEDADAYHATTWESMIGAIADGITGEDGNREEEEEMTEDDVKKIANAVWSYQYQGSDTPFNQLMMYLPIKVWDFKYRNPETGETTDNTFNTLMGLQVQVAALSAAVEELAKSQGADPDAIAKSVSDAVAEKLSTIKLEVTTG